MGSIFDEVSFTPEQIAAWRAERGNGMTSAIGEYTPHEFWLALDEIERLKEDNNRLRGMADEFRSLMVKVDQLDEKDAEIERLNNFVNGMKGIANTQGEIIAEQNEEIERLKSENALLRTGDTCARHCEGVAFRHEAQRLKKQVQDMIQAEVLLRAAFAEKERNDG